jgi:hypothetical protein
MHHLDERLELMEWPMDYLLTTSSLMPDRSVSVERPLDPKRNSLLFFGLH